MSSTGPGWCRRGCGARVLGAKLLETTREVELDLTAVVGGAYMYWSNSCNPIAMVFVAASRPTEVGPPHDMPKDQRDDWDGKAAAGSRAWFVVHRCGKSAEQVVAERRRERAA